MFKSFKFCRNLFDAYIHEFFIDPFQVRSPNVKIKAATIARWQTQYAQWVLVEGKTSKNFFKSALKIKK
jgi:hypothetical protein